MSYGTRFIEWYLGLCNSLCVCVCVCVCVSVSEPDLSKRPGTALSRTGRQNRRLMYPNSLLFNRRPRKNDHHGNPQSHGPISIFCNLQTTRFSQSQSSSLPKSFNIAGTFFFLPFHFATCRQCICL